MATPPHISLGSSSAPDAAPEVRHDHVAGRTVFVAPQRAARPADADLAAAAGSVVVPPTGARRSWCPFCVGNESRTPPAVLRTPPDESAPWRARIVPNLYPFTCDPGRPDTTPDTTPEAPPAGFRCPPFGRAARGVHDVVIEAAAHESSVLAVPPAGWREVWELVRRRLEHLAGREELVWGMVFKNSGPRAGASLAHLHSQIVALDFVPPAIEAELAAAAATTTAFRRLLDEARADGRVVAERGGLVAVVPPAPRQPFETWILPHTARAFLHEAPPEDVAALADLTRWFVERLARLAPDADYNWWLHEPPYARHHGGRGGPIDWHWHLEIVPRLAAFAGFELGTGCHVTTVSPEHSARLLRDG